MEKQKFLKVTVDEVIMKDKKIVEHLKLLRNLVGKSAMNVSIEIGASGGATGSVENGKRYSPEFVLALLVHYMYMELDSIFAPYMEIHHIDTYGECLSNIRKRLGLSHAKVAELMNTNSKSLSVLETGVHHSKPLTLWKLTTYVLCMKYEKTPAELVPYLLDSRYYTELLDTIKSV